MATFRYKAVNNAGHFVRGRIDAVNEPDLESRLKNMGLELIVHEQAKQRQHLFGGTKIKRQDLINFCFHMEQMTKAGIPILESLEDLRDSMENPRFREIISSLIGAIEGGKRFSEALGQYPAIFDTVFISLVEAGEQSGELDKVLGRMTDSLKWQDELIAKTKKLMLYPAFVGTVVMAVVFFMMIYLVPQMVNFIKSMDGELPFHTRALIATSNVFIDYWYLILSMPFVLLFTLKLLAHHSPKARYRIDQFKLSAWLIGPILRKIILARFASYFALLYRSGVTVLSCLSICEDLTGNAVIKKALTDAARLTTDGMKLSDAIDNVGLFPPLVLRMLKVGENTGRLDVALENVSYFYNREVAESIERLQALIEPIMTVILGAILGWLMLSVLGPIYDIISTIK